MSESVGQDTKQTLPYQVFSVRLSRSVFETSYENKTMCTMHIFTSPTPLLNVYYVVALETSVSVVCM